MPQSENEGRECRDARLASFSYDNGHKLSPDLQAQGPTSRRTSHLYIALGGRIAGKYVGPCRLQLGTHQGEGMEYQLLQPQSEPMERRTQACSLKGPINLGVLRDKTSLPLVLDFFPGGPVTGGAKMWVCRV
jgi:hypothetical protein